MESMFSSGTNLLPERSRLSQTNMTTNKVNLIPSHYPPPLPTCPGISLTENRMQDVDFIMLSSGHSFPVNLGLGKTESRSQRFASQDSSPPPLPPREPTGFGGSAVSHRVAAPVPICPSTTEKGRFPKGCLDQIRIPESQMGTNLNCMESSSLLNEPVLLNPAAHHHVLKQMNTDQNVTHHCWNVLQGHPLPLAGIVSNKDLSGLTVNPVADDKQCDGSTKIASSSQQQQSAVLNQVIPLSRWPIGSRQPETHFVLDRVVARPQAGNEYVESPLHTTSKDLQQHPVTSKRTNSASVRLENSTQDCSAVVTLQPVLSAPGKPNCTKPTNETDGKETLSPRHPPCKEGLICLRCGKCRCMSCTQPRQMPRCWIGPSFYKCECSAQQAVNICSCLCCVQTLFYHCLYHPDDDHDIMTEPCACCERPRCCLRWTILGLLVPCLPCLCLYCPLQCGIDACTSCYNGCNQRGCHCGYNVSSSGSSTTRDLLLDSEPSST